MAQSLVDFLDSEQGRTMEWPMLVRHAMGTDNKVFLHAAAARCGDEKVQEYLLAIAQADTHAGRFHPELHELAKVLLSRLSSDAAILIELLWRRFNIHLALHNKHAESVIKNELTAVLQAHLNAMLHHAETRRLDECTAAFMMTIAAYWARTDNWTYAANTMSHAISAWGDVLQHHVKHSPRPIAIAYSVVACRCLLDGSEYFARAGDEQRSMHLLHVLTGMFPRDDEMALPHITLMRDAANELIRRRLFSESVKWARRAIAGYRKLMEEQPGKQVLYDYAICVGSVAQGLLSAGEVRECRAQCLIALRTLHQMRDCSTEPLIGAHATIYQSLAHACLLTDARRSAAKYFQRAAKLYEQAAVIDDVRAWGTVLVTTLCNCGAVLHELQQLDASESAFVQAQQWSSRLAEVSPYTRVDQEWHAYGGHALVCADTERAEDALRHGEHALSLLASVDVHSADRWSVIGLAWKLRVRMLALYFERGCTDDVLRLLGGLIAPGVQTEAEAKDLFGNIMRELASLGERRGKHAIMLIAQRSVDAFYFAVIDPSKDTPLVVRSTTFDEPAMGLWAFAFGGGGHAGDDEWKERAEGCWDSLPLEVHRYLDPKADCVVVLVGSDGFINFPWEALRFGTGEDEALGLHIEFIRLSALTTDPQETWSKSYTLRVRPECAVICPWNVGSPRLVYAREEAAAVSSWLSDAVGNLDDSNRIIGSAATVKQVSRLVSGSVDIVHYTGHGTNDGDEEALVLASETGWTTLGAAAIEMARSTLSADKRTQVVILNCCNAGRMRVYGGRRMDLAAALLRTGAAAVVASASPIGDVAGAIFGLSFHALATQAGNRRPLSAVVVDARRFVHDCMRLVGESAWRTWCHVAYHGRPDVYYTATPPSDDAILTSLSDRVAKLLRDAQPHSRVEECLIKQIAQRRFVANTQL